MKKLLFVSFISILIFSGCGNQKNHKSVDNLKAGIKGETTASAKYADFAEKARTEGFGNIAILFDAASYSESIHAANHRKALVELGEKMDDFKPEFEVKTTSENLPVAIEGESYEVATMYPQFLADAETEKAVSVVSTFTWALNAEKKHLDFYQKALTALQQKAQNTLPSGYAVCPVCGNTFKKSEIVNYCPSCGTLEVQFHKF